MMTVHNERFRTFEPGRIGSVEGAPLTTGNYTEMFLPVYLGYFRPISSRSAHLCWQSQLHEIRPPWCEGGFSLLIGLMFLSALVRVYALQLTFVVVGLLHYARPMSILILIGAVQNKTPRLTEAAQSLSASALTSHLTITIPVHPRACLCFSNVDVAWHKRFHHIVGPRTRARNVRFEPLVGSARSRTIPAERRYQSS
ncbi:hypothetical protein ACVWWI_006503 [Bradyrhizobium sp. USDA 3686]|nr:hypothetical protein [Bradyrhizobium canariense]